jgi:hypothetical protein
MLSASRHDAPGIKRFGSSVAETLSGELCSAGGALESLAPHAASTAVVDTHEKQKRSLWLKGAVLS